jgi:hypothetical protein
MACRNPQDLDFPQLIFPHPRSDDFCIIRLRSCQAFLLQFRGIESPETRVISGLFFEKCEKGSATECVFFAVPEQSKVNDM